MAIKMVVQLWADRQAEDYADPEANKGKSVSNCDDVTACSQAGPGMPA